MLSNSARKVGPKVGTRNIEAEDLRAVELFGSLSEEQKKTAWVGREAPRHLNSGPPTKLPMPTPDGIAAEDLQPEQRATLEAIVAGYLSSLPESVAAARKKAIEAGGAENLRFAWFGSPSDDQPYYYRLQGPTFLAEFDNTQKDAYGRDAGHIHSVWRSPKGDFKD